jgi:hypothetical protein
MEAILSSETSVHTRSTQCYLPDDGILQELVFSPCDGKQILLFSSVHAGNPPILLSSGYQGLLPQEVKQLGHEADHSRPSNGDDNAWNYTSTPQVMLWCFIKLGEYYFIFVTTYYL